MPVGAGLHRLWEEKGGQRCTGRIELLPQILHLLLDATLPFSSAREITRPYGSEILLSMRPWR